MNATHGEVRDLKLKLDGDFGVVLSCIVLDGRETKLSSHEVFLSTWELLDAPNHATFVWNILHSADVGLKDRAVNINWYWNNDFHIVGN